MYSLQVLVQKLSALERVYAVFAFMTRFSRREMIFLDWYEIIIFLWELVDRSPF